MKKRNIVLFLGIFVLLLIGTSALFMPKDNTVEAGIDERDENAYGILAEEEDTIDVIVLGDSLCCTGISPLRMWEKQGITSYVCGQTAQRMTESYYILKRALKNQKPKLVILETNLLFWPPDTEEQMNQALFECASYYLPVFEYHNQWKSLDPGDFDEAEYENKMNNKGFYMKKDCVPYMGGEYMLETMTAWEVPRVERFYLGKMVELCRKEGIEFILLSVPSPKDYCYEKHNSVQLLAGKYGISYLDMNLVTGEIGIDWNEDILDGAEHLNVYGAEKASTYLADYLAENYEMPDHRDEKAYQSWSDCYDRYMESLKKES